MNHEGVVSAFFLTTKILLTGDTPHCQVPGGFGAVGQPNDGWHQCHHSLARSFALSSIKWSSNFDLRKDFSQLSKSIQGSTQTKHFGFPLKHFFVETSRLLQVGPREGILSVVIFFYI